MDAVIVDCKTGLTTRRELTPDEVVQQEADAAAAAATSAAQQQAEQQRADAITTLKLSANKDTQDLLIALGLD